MENVVTDSIDNAVIHFLNVATDVSIDNFNNRLKIQKLVYLAEELGLNFGFAFDWYARGPYSPSLTRVIFEAEELDTLKLQNVVPTEKEKIIIDLIKKLIGDDFNDTRKLELFASVWYVLPIGNVSIGKKIKSIEYLFNHKPFFEKEEYEDTIQKIQEFRRNVFIN